MGAERTLAGDLALPAVSVSLCVFTSDLAGFCALALVLGLACGGVMPLDAILLREVEAMAIAFTFRLPRVPPAALPSPGVAS